jgi:glycosyltransferase involved in cell wall biosynthesis
MSPTSLRVGIDGRAFTSPARGVRRYVTELCRALHALDAEVTLVVIGARPDAQLPVELSAVPELLALPTNLGRHVSSLPIAIQRARLGVYHAPAYTAPLFGATPVVLTIHDVSYARQPAWYPYRRDPLRRAFYRHSACRAQQIITDSEFSRGEIVAAYGTNPQRMHVIPCGVSPAFHPAPRDRPRPLDLVPAEPYVLHVGDLHLRRNLAAALRAVIGVRRRHAGLASLGLVLAGADRGGGADLVREASRAGHQGAVLLAGVVTEERLLALYQHADAFVYPSRYEGFGLPLLEAMACGRPVIASTAGALPEIVGDAGILCDPDDEPGFSGAVEQALLAPGTANELGARARKRAQSFTWRRTAEQTLEVYRTCVSPMSRSSS